MSGTPVTIAGRAAAWCGAVSGAVAGPQVTSSAASARQNGVRMRPILPLTPSTVNA
jgi:hypothetical protein